MSLLRLLRWKVSYLKRHNGSLLRIEVQECPDRNSIPHGARNMFEQVNRSFQIDQRIKKKGDSRERQMRIDSDTLISFKGDGWPSTPPCCPMSV
jgi:hypothetical protein